MLIGYLIQFAVYGKVPDYSIPGPVRKCNLSFHILWCKKLTTQETGKYRLVGIFASGKKSISGIY